MTATPAAKFNLPMQLTLARLIAGPIIAALVLWANAEMFAGGPALSGLLYAGAALLFALAALTDWLDGALARRMNAVSTQGAALDHVADKVLVALTLGALAYAALPLDLVIAALVLIGRDLAVAGLRESAAGQGKPVPVDAYGKIKAAAAMAGVAAFLFYQAAGLLGAGVFVLEALIWIARTLLWTAAALSLWSGARYARVALG